MKYALIQQARVANIIEADEEFAAQIASDWDHVEALDTLHEQGLGVAIGWSWDVEGGFAPPEAPPMQQAELPVWLWYIDKGPFFDRFGAAKMDVLTSADAGVKAILSDLQNRHWIDLQRSDVASALAYVGSKVPSVTSTLRQQVLTTPVSESENLALRKLFF